MSNQIDNTQNISNLITLVNTGKLKKKSVRANGTAGKKPECMPDENRGRRMHSSSARAPPRSDYHNPLFPNKFRFSNTVHTNLVSIQTAGKQADKNILPICTHFALLESPMQLEIMHGGKFSDRALLIARSIRCILADQRSR